MNIDAIKIEIWLAELGITKAELAERSGLSRQTIHNIVWRGTCEPRTAGKLARGLGLDVPEILNG